MPEIYSDLPNLLRIVTIDYRIPKSAGFLLMSEIHELFQEYFCFFTFIFSKPFVPLRNFSQP